jgi:hypothetical protein
MLRDFKAPTSQYKDKTIIGLTERLTVKGRNDVVKTILARIDSGATKSSIDIKLAAELKLGPIVKTKLVRSASGSGIRPVVNVDIMLCDKTFNKAEFTLADRSEMKYKILIGQDILRDGFLIDPSKKTGNID